MANSKKQKAKASKALQKLAMEGLAGVEFEREEITEAFETMAQSTETGEAVEAEKANAARQVCTSAYHYALACIEEGADRELALKGFNSNMATVAQQLNTTGNRFVEQLPPKKDGDSPTYRFTGYGNNVVSIARGCIEFDIDTDSMVDEEGNPASFRSIRDVVQRERQQKRHKANPELAAWKDCVSELDDTFKALRSSLMEEKDAELVGLVTGELRKVSDVIQRMREEAEAAAAREAEEIEAEEIESGEVNAEEEEAEAA